MDTEKTFQPTANVCGMCFVSFEFRPGLFKKKNECLVFFSLCRSFALIPSNNLQKLSEMIEILCANGFSLSNCGMFELSRNDSIEVVKQILQSNGNTKLGDTLSMGPIVAILLTGSDAINRLNKLISGMR